MANNANLETLLNGLGTGSRQCLVGRFISGLDENVAAILNSKLQTRTITNPSIVAVLSAGGFIVSDEGLRRHRNNACACARAEVA